MPTPREAVPFTEPVEYFCWNERKRAPAAAIGPDGLVLEADGALPAGALVTLRLRLPEAGAFTVLGRVRSDEERPDGQVGIDFLDISPAHRAQILRYARGSLAA